MLNKGLVSILEMVFTVILLFVSLQIFFPGFKYSTRWDEAHINQITRDLLVSMDRSGVLYKNSFFAPELANFLNIVIPTSTTNLIGWSESEGTIKSRITVACNCTQTQINILNNWFGNLKLNGRNITILIVSSALEDINDPEKQADALFIWGYQPISATQKNEMKKFLDNEKGIVEMADITTASQIDSAQQTIFGLQYISSTVPVAPAQDTFTRSPTDSQDIIYGPYKYFYHVPLPLAAFSSISPTVPVEGISACTDTLFTEGNFTFNSLSYGFWICNQNSVYFDTDRNGKANNITYAGNDFTLGGYNFILSYINGNSTIGVQFRSPYNFEDFVKTPVDFQTRLYPIDNDKSKVLIEADKAFANPDNNKNVSVVILNRTGKVANTAWIADFSTDFTTTQDDKRMLLLSLVLWSSNKKAISVLQPNIKIGYATSYVNVVNDDMFEIYKFNLGLGNPF